MITKTCVHTINVGDVDDPDLYVADPIYRWQNTEEGKWVMEHSVEIPEWHRLGNINTFGYTYVIEAMFNERDLLMWKLKYE